MRISDRQLKKCQSLADDLTREELLIHIREALVEHDTANFCVYATALICQIDDPATITEFVKKLMALSKEKTKK